MASVRCVRNEEISVQLSVEEKASVDEMMKQAELSLESQELLDQPIGVVAENESLGEASTKLISQFLVGVLANKTKGPLTVATKIYAGYIVKNFPNSTSFAITGDFCMASTFDKGVKAAVVYSGKNKAGVECARLLAFARTKPTRRRIYGKCGHMSKFNNIDWADVEQKLNNADAVAKAHDEDTGTSLYAAIAGSDGKSAVSAIFLG